MTSTASYCLSSHLLISVTLLLKHTENAVVRRGHLIFFLQNYIFRNFHFSIVPRPTQWNMLQCFVGFWLSLFYDFFLLLLFYTHKRDSLFDLSNKKYALIFFLSWIGNDLRCRSSLLAWTVSWCCGFVVYWSGEV